MKNKLSDLNNHLFAQLERLGDETINPEQLAQEIDRGKAISSLAKDIIANGKLVLDAQIAIGDNLIKTIPKMLGMDHEFNQ